MRHAGLQAGALEPTSLATMRAYLAGAAERRPVALLVPAERHSDLCIHDGTRVRQLRRIPAGSADMIRYRVTEAGSEMFSLYEAGEARPARPAGAEDPAAQEDEPTGAAPPESTVSSAAAFDLPPAAAAGEPAFGPTDLSDGGNMERADPVASAVGAVPFIVSEVSRSLAFYAREHPDEAPPESLVILAPSELGREMESLFDGTQPIPVAAADILAPFRLPPPAGAPAKGDDPAGIAAALGAALGAAGLESGIPRLDVARELVAEAARRRPQRLVVTSVGGSVAWFLLSAVATIVITVLIARAEGESRQLEAAIQALEASRAPALEAARNAEAAQEARKRAEVPAAAILGRVAAAAGRGISLTRLGITADGKINLEGRTVDSPSMQEFALRLTQGRTIRRAVPESWKQDERGEITFRMAAAFRAPAKPQPASSGE
jgi:hypothetical protein